MQTMIQLLNVDIDAATSATVHTAVDAATIAESFATVDATIAAAVANAINVSGNTATDAIDVAVDGGDVDTVVNTAAVVNATRRGARKVHGAPPRTKPHGIFLFVYDVPYLKKWVTEKKT